MRRRVELTLLLAALALVTACDTEQPAEGGDKVISLQFKAQEARAYVYDLFPVVEAADSDGNGDFNGDGLPDPALFCEKQVGGERSVTTVPWGYTIRISVLPNGDTTKQTVIAEYAPLANLTPYDPSFDSAGSRNPDIETITHPRGICQGNPALICNPELDDGTEGDPETICENVNADPCSAAGTCTMTTETKGCALDGTDFSCTQNGTCDCVALGLQIGADLGICEADGFCTNALTGFDRFACLEGCTEQVGVGSECEASTMTRKFEFSEGKEVSSAYRELLASSWNPLNALKPSEFPDSVCPGQDYGDPGIRREGEPYLVHVNKGDVLIVEGRFRSEIPPGLQLQTPPQSVGVLVEIDGRSVTPDGSLGATRDQSQAISFTVK